MVISTVSATEFTVPSFTTKLNVSVSGELLESVGAVKVGLDAVSSDRVTPVPAVCTH